MSLSGRVKWFSDQRGYGFVTGDDGTEAFVRWEDVIGSHEPYTHNLTEGDTVTFELEETDKGLRARKVQVTAHGAPRRSVWQAVAALERRVTALENAS